MNTDVYRNLLRLASGIESVVVGKAEILDEIKNMSSSAKQAGNSGKILDKLFDSSIRIATDIRNSTGIGIGIKSIGDIAVNLAEEKVGNIGSKKILYFYTWSIRSLLQP
jgi:glutamyl-tRNA reductase